MKTPEEFAREAEWELIDRRDDEEGAIDLPALTELLRKAMAGAWQDGFKACWSQYERPEKWHLQNPYAEMTP